MLHRRVPGAQLRVLEGQINHRILTLVILVLFPAFPDCLIPKIDRSVLIGLFKESADHVHVQGLAKSPGTGEQGHGGHVVQEVPDQQRLIHPVVVFDDRAIIGDAHRQRKGGRAAFFPITAGFDSAICRTFRVCGNYPAFAIFISAGNSPFLAQNRDPALGDSPSLCRFSDSHGRCHMRHPLCNDLFTVYPIFRTMSNIA